MLEHLKIFFREGDSRFSEALLHLESSPECQSLSFHSFLMLPMQRICRLRLLLEAVLHRLEPEHDEYNSCKLAFASLNKVCVGYICICTV